MDTVVEANDNIRTNAGTRVGSWDGQSVQMLKKELARIREAFAAEESKEKLVPRDMPHREQIPDELRSFNAYPIWGCDQTGSCLVGASANRIEPVQKVLAFSLVEHHSANFATERHATPAAPEDGDYFKHILIATDGSDLASKGVVRGLALAKKLGARVTILSVFEPLPEMAVRAALRGGITDPVGQHDKEIDDELHNRYLAIEKEATKYGVTVDLQHELSHVPAEAIVRAAEFGNCDLIVMASHGRRGLSKLLLGSQTADVLVRTKIPVLVIR